MRKLLLSKRGAGGGFPYGERWAELWTIVMFVLALVIALFSPSAAFIYLLAILLGFGCGRYLQLRYWRFPYFLVVLGLLIGFTLGARYGSRKVILFLFIVGFAVSHWLHKHGKIK